MKTLNEYIELNTNYNFIDEGLIDWFAKIIGNSKNIKNQISNFNTAQKQAFKDTIESVKQNSDSKTGKLAIDALKKLKDAKNNKKSELDLFMNAINDAITDKDNFSQEPLATLINLANQLALELDDTETQKKLKEIASKLTGNALKKLKDVVKNTNNKETPQIDADTKKELNDITGYDTKKIIDIINKDILSESLNINEEKTTDITVIKDFIKNTTDEKNKMQ